VTAQRVFIPRIGVRAAGPRTLTEPRETFAHETRLTLLAVAAAVDRTDVVVEWERDGATCTADTRLVAALRHDDHSPLDRMTIVLDTETSALRAIASWRPSFGYGEHIRAVQTSTFPSLGGDTFRSALHVREGAQEWRVPFTLEPADLNARALAVQVERDGVVVRATAVARSEDELVVALEAQATRSIRQVGWPEFFSKESAGRLAPITLEDDRGGRVEEVRRLFWMEPQQSAPDEPFFSRFSVVFEAPHTDVRRAVLVVPFVALNGPEHSVTVDLRDVPIDVALGEHRFRVVRTEAHGTEQQKVVMELPPPTANPRFVQPRQMRGADAKNVAWQSEPVSAESAAGAIWMATPVGDPPVVTFSGVVLRVDGPFRLDLPLA